MRAEEVEGGGCGWCCSEAQAKHGSEKESMEVRKKAWLIEELHFGGKGVNGGE